MSLAPAIWIIRYTFIEKYLKSISSEKKNKKQNTARASHQKTTYTNNKRNTSLNSMILMEALTLLKSNSVDVQHHIEVAIICRVGV